MKRRSRLKHPRSQQESRHWLLIEFLKWAIEAKELKCSSTARKTLRIFFSKDPE